MNVVLYARYSTDRQGDSSIEDQLALCRRYAERCGHRSSPKFSDAAISGTHAERPGLQAMLADVSKSKGNAFRAVLVESQSRLSRDLFGALELIYRDLARHNVRLIDVSGYDSSTEIGEMQTAMQGMFNAQYVKQVSKMTHRGLDGRARGGFSTGGSLFGYRTEVELGADPNRARHVWQIEEAEAAVVRHIFELVERGDSYRTIADTFNRENVEAPRNNGRGGKHGVVWSHVSVRAIVMNEKYVGRWTWNTTKWVRLPASASAAASRGLSPSTSRARCPSSRSSTARPGTACTRGCLAGAAATSARRVEDNRSTW